MMWYWGNAVHWWEWLLGFVGMVAFWGVVIWAAWYFVSGLTRRPYEQPPAGDGAKRILDERLARGEIDAEEYRRLLAVLRGEPASRTDGRPPVGTSGPV